MFRRRTNRCNEKLVRYLISLIENNKLYEDDYRTHRCHEAVIYSLGDLLPNAPPYLIEEIADLLMQISKIHKDWEVRVAAIRTLPKINIYKHGISSKQQRRTSSVTRRLNLSFIERGLKWLSILMGIGLIGSVVLSLLGVTRVGMIELKTVINILAITIGGSLFSWGGIIIFSMKRSLIELQNLKVEKCPFRDIVDFEILKSFGPSGSAGFCIDLIRCNLYRYKEHCKCVHNYQVNQDTR